MTNLIHFLIFLSFGSCDLSAPQNIKYEKGQAEIDRGKELAFAYGCATCHQIGGLKGHPSWVGPPLKNWNERKYISGKLPNNKANLVRWIMSPKKIEPGTAMPDLGVTREEAQAIANFLNSQ